MARPGMARGSEPPVEVILLVDEANNLLHNIAYERYQIDRFLTQNGGHLSQPVSLMVFTDRGGPGAAAALDRRQCAGEGIR